MTKQVNRNKDFHDIYTSLANQEYFSNEKCILVNGDSQKVLSSIPDSSISLILTDPPYHSTKKENIINDKAFKSDDDFLDWMEDLCFVHLQWRENSN